MNFTRMRVGLWAEQQGLDASDVMLWWGERAAIRQHLANVPVQEAERLALCDVMEAWQLGTLQARRAQNASHE